ncbi:hypothetical protein AltI4_44930 (plasmid) [Alteromonas sp. I4]|nr:hypothetical protein AltI4_44930 [Alteromonas sp. I4]
MVVSGTSPLPFWGWLGRCPSKLTYRRGCKRDAQVTNNAVFVLANKKSLLHFYLSAGLGAFATCYNAEYQQNA